MSQFNSSLESLFTDFKDGETSPGARTAEKVAVEGDAEDGYVVANSMRKQEGDSSTGTTSNSGQNSAATETGRHMF